MRLFLPQPLRPLLLLAVLLVSAGSRLFAQAPAWQDAISPGAGRGITTAIDTAGNTYVTGNFYGTATFGAITLTSAGDEDVFVAKRTPAGAWQWATSAGGRGADGSSSVTVDGSGSVVIAGFFNSPTITFGATTLGRTGGAADLFVAKLTPAGAWQWATGAVGSADDFGFGVAVDGSGSVVVTGYFYSPTITFGTTTLTNAGLADVFVAKLTPAGAWQWATGAGGTGSDVSFGVAVDGNGSVVVTGYFASPTITFGATTLTNAGYQDFFVAKLTPAGVWQWATGVGDIYADGGGGVAVDSSGSVMVTGYFSGTATFGATTLTSAGLTDVFVAKLTPAGVWQWATGAGARDSDFGSGIAVDGSGSVVVTGGFPGGILGTTITFGTTTLTSAGRTDLFVAKLTPAGAWQWATSAGDIYADYGFSVAVDGSGSVAVTGTFSSPTITFGTATLTNPVPGLPATFLARLNGTTGLPEAPDPAGLTLTPNPARTTVQLTGATGPTATLLDGLGRLVGTAAITQGAATLDVRALPAGLYLLRAGRATRRLVVE